MEVPGAASQAAAAAAAAAESRAGTHAAGLEGSSLDIGNAVHLSLLLDMPSYKDLAAAYLLPPRPPAWYTLGLQDVGQGVLEQQRRRLLRTWLSKSSPAIPEACVGGWLERWCVMEVVP
jgi:hypothetical protein